MTKPSRHPIWYPAITLLLAGCAGGAVGSETAIEGSIEAGSQRGAPSFRDKGAADAAENLPLPNDEQFKSSEGQPDDVEFFEVPSLSDKIASGEDDEAVEQLEFADRELSVSIPPQSVPEFINTVFGEILGMGFVMGPSVSERKEIISFRSAKDISDRALFETARNALKDYGISVIPEDGGVKILETDQLRRSAPRFVRSRARAAVPSGLRPVVQHVDLMAISANEMASSLRVAFPDKDTLSVTPSGTLNSITLTGLPEDVDRALTIIYQLDELEYAGARAGYYTVQNWDTKVLAQEATELLQLEGFSISNQRGVQQAIAIKALEYTNQIVVLAKSNEMLDYVIETIRRLDRAAQPQRTLKAWVYQAQYYEATELVDILASAYGDIGMAPDDERNRAPQPGPMMEPGNAQGEDGPGQAVGKGGFTVDPQGNRIIFRSTSEEYREIVQLLRLLDTPANEVLIEVTIAEITLTDDLQYGVEFLIEQLGSTGYSVGTLGGLGLSPGGLSGSYSSGDYLVDFSTLASNNLINVLSTPRIVTKSGASASIQVGTDIPIITSQSAGSSQSNGSTDILQSVEYRKTGILLDIEPLVYSDNRIDLTISQEVSSSLGAASQSIPSPTISNRSISTSLTLQDGQSAVLGGLIENRYIRDERGIPFLKDTPVIGGIFRSETLSSTQTVLMVMITPYVLNSRDDRQRVVDALARTTNGAFETGSDSMNTMRHRQQPFRIEPSAQKLPPPETGRQPQE